MPSARAQRQSHFWRATLEFQADKVMPALGMRNAIGVATPLLLGVIFHNSDAGLLGGIGALLVAYSDNQTPYLQRARRMVIAGVLSAVAVLAGVLCASSLAGSVIVAGAAAFAAGLAYCLGNAAGEVGADVLVALLIFATRPLALRPAVEAAGLVLAGGLLQILLSLALWPLHRYGPERRVLGNLYLALADVARAPADVAGSPSASRQSNEAQHALATLDWSRSAESQRCRALLSQAERIRLSVIALSSLRGQLLEFDADEDGEAIARSFALTVLVLESIGKSLHGTPFPRELGATAVSFAALTERLRRTTAGPAVALAKQAVAQLDALAGQLRASIDLARRTMPTAYVAPTAAGDASLRARARGVVVALLANLNLRSAACRHAVRLMTCVMAGDLLARVLDLPRSYWVPMTIAIVLKPDFSSTFVRGLARLSGTLLGLVIATALFHVLPADVFVQVLAVAGLTFLLRCFGAANYVVFVTAVTALIVFILALGGVRPADAMAARGINTAAGGAIALVAYWLWPTWERRQVADLMAAMLEGYRTYFHTFRTLGRSSESSPVTMRLADGARLQSRLARSNMEASLTRLRVEPDTRPEQLLLLSGILANTYRLAHSLIALEAHFATVGSTSDDPTLENFAENVEKTLMLLAGSLRSGTDRTEKLPNLREDHRVLAAAEGRDAYLAMEADRLTNSLNTLAGELAQWNRRDERGAF